MIKRISFIMMTALVILSTLIAPASAASGRPYDMPTPAAGSPVYYMSYVGQPTNDGLTPATAVSLWAPQAGTTDTGVAARLNGHGGTIVAVQKLFAGADYTLPEQDAPLLITGVYNGTDYRNLEPAANPASGVFKFQANKVFTFQSDVTFDDIILFHEHTPSMPTTIKITNNSTLAIGPGVIFANNPDKSENAYINFEVEAGSTLIFNTDYPGDVATSIKGTGDVIGLSNTSNPVVTNPPADTTKAPDTTTAAPAVTDDTTTNPDTADTAVWFAVAALASVVCLTVILATSSKKRSR
jgi:hypothetical protein